MPSFCTLFLSATAVATFGVFSFARPITQPDKSLGDIEGIFNGAVSHVNSMIDNVQSTTDGAISQGNSMIGDARNAANNAVPHVNSMIGNVQGAVDGAISQSNSMIGNIQSTADGTISQGNSMISDLQNAANNAVSQVNSMIGNVRRTVDGAVSQANSVMGNVQGTVVPQGQLNSIIGNLEGIINGAVPQANSAKGLLQRKLDNVASQLSTLSASNGDNVDPSVVSGYLQDVQDALSEALVQVKPLIGQPTDIIFLDGNVISPEDVRFHLAKVVKLIHKDLSRLAHFIYQTELPIVTNTGDRVAQLLTIMFEIAPELGNILRSSSKVSSLASAFEELNLPQVTAALRG